MMRPVFFADQTEFRTWLEKNHNEKTELMVGYYKVKTKKPSMTWSQSVDQALCFGWIDGIRRSIDKDSYCIRFTPRRKNSNWSTINISKVEELTKQGLMKPEGLEAFAHRKEEKSGIDGFGNNPKKLIDRYEITFKANKIAWNFFTQQAPSYQKTIIEWIVSARQEKTQLKRLEKVIAESEKQKRVY